MWEHKMSIEVYDFVEFNQWHSFLLNFNLIENQFNRHSSIQMRRGRKTIEYAKLCKVVNGVWTYHNAAHCTTNHQLINSNKTRVKEREREKIPLYPVIWIQLAIKTTNQDSSGPERRLMMVRQWSVCGEIRSSFY